MARFTDCGIKMVGMQADKAQMRRSLLKTRSQIGANDWEENNQRICQHLQGYYPFTGARTLLAYFSTRKEPDVSNLWMNSDSVWGFPRCVGKELIWHQWQPSQRLNIGAYGIKEPLDNSPIITANQVDLILVPCLGCDESGYRLGYGGGFYDRLFSVPEWKKIPKVGITFAFTLVSKLPIEPWDCQLDAVCTETGVIEF